ncbi:MAG: serine hydrolase [Anaerolineae bacterium]
MHDEIAATVANVEATFGAAAHDWATGATVAYNADRTFITASVIKFPILLAALDRVQRGELALTERVELRPEDVVGGSGLLKEFDPGVRLTVKDYLTAMIVISDNSATNLMLRLLGIPELNGYLASLGLTVTRSLRPIRFPAPRPGEPRGIGETTPAEMVRLLDMLVSGSILNDELRQLALDILRRQQYADAIPRYLPDGVVVAHKDGMVNDIRADVGIVYPPDRSPITIAVLCDGLTDRRYSVDNAGFLGIGRISKVIYDRWVGA